MPDESYQVVLITVGNQEEAESIAEALVTDRLAACVNIIQHCRSIYRWAGKINRDDELLMMVKTRRTLFPAVRDRVIQMHSYNVPEIIALDIQNGSQAYYEFLKDNLKSDPSP
jgi:periplasmic divalent cation tolerance protein